MGYGDNIMATGLAKGAAARGKRIAFGEAKTKKLLWDHHSELIFRNNPNIAEPGTEFGSDVQWIEYYRGKRDYNIQVGKRWRWNYSWQPIPGEFYFDEQELFIARQRFTTQKAIIIEPNILHWKISARNKDWGWHKWNQLGKHLIREGFPVCQFKYEGAKQLDWVPQIETRDIRQAAAMLQRAALLVTPEGGMHHAAAAVGTKAIVIFGGFIPPQVTGYDSHINLVGSDIFCGSLEPCQHCRRALDAITVNQVLETIEFEFKQNQKCVVN